MKWEEILLNNISGKRLISKTYKELIHPIATKIIPAEIWAKDLNRHVSNVHEKKLNITNEQVNAKENHNELSPHTWENGSHIKGKRQERINRMCRGEVLCTAGGNLNWHRHYENRYGSFKKIKNRTTI